MTSADLLPAGYAACGQGHEAPRFLCEVLNAKLEENL